MDRCLEHLKRLISSDRLERCFVFRPDTRLRHNEKLEGFNRLRIRAITSGSRNPNWNSMASKGVRSSHPISIMRLMSSSVITMIKQNQEALVIRFAAWKIPVSVLPTRWLPGKCVPATSGRPHHLISSGRKCWLVIGLHWTRWGLPHTDARSGWWWAVVCHQSRVRWLRQKFLRYDDILQSTAGGNAIVTADAAVNKDVQANTFVGGASAKFIKAIGWDAFLKFCTFEID